MDALILKLDIAGQPINWVTAEEGVVLYCKDQVVWEAGSKTVLLRGGISRATGSRSSVAVNTIVATRRVNASGLHGMRRAALSNSQLFRRDGGMCMYCGLSFPHSLLTRDHVLPRARGGRDVWENVVSCCRSCNQRKGCFTPEEAGMPLLAVPYAPNVAEALILHNRAILADQMAFLRARVGGSSRLRE